jgi:rhodanese-related sulfurtransferase/2-polyprenyl-3-methyl-5-hydroxy-6-metoxy-1,4-benzoquinol methylase
VGNIEAISRPAASRPQETNILKSGFDHFGKLAPLYERFIPPRIPEELVAFVNMPVDGVILDAGGGTGRVAQFLRDDAGQVLVADESMEMLKEVRKKAAMHPVCSHAENTPFKAGCVDRIIVVDVLHHVADQVDAAEELWRILKPGGRIVIEEPDVRSIGVKVIAFAEKLALMRSHFLPPARIAGLFRYPNARVRVETSGPTAWIIVDKETAE